MPWQLAISLSIIASAATTLIQRRYSQKSTAPETFPSATSYLLGVMPVGIIAGLLLPHQVHWSLWLGLLLIIVASSAALSGWIGFRAVKLLSVVAYQTISRFTSVVTITLGWIVLSEGLGIFQLLGAIILLAAAVLTSWAPAKNIESIKRRVHLRAVLLTLFASTMLAIALVTQKAILNHMQVGGVLIFDWGAQTIAMLILALKDASRANLRRFRSYEIKWSSFMGLANGITGAFYVYALNKSNNISLITALTAVTLPLVIFGARYLLKERENQKLVWIGLTISFMGLLVTSL